MKNDEVNKKRNQSSGEEKRGAQTEMSAINIVARMFGFNFCGNRVFLEAHARPSGFPITHNPL